MNTSEIEKDITEDIVKILLTSGTLTLKPTQNRLCLPILKRLCIKMSMNISFPEIQLDGDYIVNGHHRYVASKLVDFEMKSVRWLKAHSTQTYRWEDLVIDTRDWETLTDVREHIKRDVKIHKIDEEYLTNLIINS